MVTVKAHKAEEVRVCMAGWLVKCYNDCVKIRVITEENKVENLQITYLEKNDEQIEFGVGRATEKE